MRMRSMCRLHSLECSNFAGQLREEAQPSSYRDKRGRAFPMRWFGFGFNAFGQICVHEKVAGMDVASEVKVIRPTELADGRGCSLKTSQVKASWSRRASLHVIGESYATL